MDLNSFKLAGESTEYNLDICYNLMYEVLVKSGQKKALVKELNSLGLT